MTVGKNSELGFAPSPCGPKVAASLTCFDFVFGVSAQATSACAQTPDISLHTRTDARAFVTDAFGADVASGSNTDELMRHAFARAIE